MPDPLHFVAFTPDLLDEVQDFDCGEQPFQQELAEWIQKDAVPAMARGTKVWLYVNQAGEVVGYGSLGVTRWKYPDAASRRAELLIIPAVALRKAFWGKPDGPPKERYSSQIMEHLLAEALAWPGKPLAVGLFVRPENVGAIKLYERFGFRPFGHTYTDPQTGVTYRSFIRPLGQA
jgi:GNAT superfamily N-acetyltransferase